jgi:hypothetical protein
MLSRGIDRRTALAALAALAASAATGITGSAVAMTGYRWKKRPLVVFAASDDAAAAQRAVVAADRAGFAERDVVIVYVIGTSVTSDLGGGPGLDAGAMRARYGVAAKDFRALLVGKDGGVKLSSPAPLSAATLFREIDGMPMRQQEMRRRG